MAPTDTLQDLEDLVVDHYPYPIASCYRRLLESEPGAGAFGSLLDTFEALLHFLLTVVLSAYWRDGTPKPRGNQYFLRQVYKRKGSTGTLLPILLDATRGYRERGKN